MVLYRKYRPQTLNDLIGQDVVKKTLLDAISANKLSHAYLFVGPRGTGKTSTARILAKMINCEEVIGSQFTVSSSKNKPTNEPTNNQLTIPCNECSTCLSITDGSNLDLIEIDAASNRGIDDVRSLRENIKLSPSGKGKKIYIIDEVHMLTTEAFNALLKTLEEPPEHAIFILATTEANKIPATILSRVTRIDFKMAKSEDLIKALQLVAKGENLEIEPEALNLIAKKADGSFRDAVKLLDQLAGTGKVLLKNVSDELAVAPFEGVLTILQYLSKKDSTKALTEVNLQLSGGAGVKELTLQMMEVLRELVLLKNGIKVTEKDYKDLDFSMADLVNILDKLQESFEKLKFASIPSLPLELAMVGVCGEQKQTMDDRKMEDRTLKVEDSKIEKDQSSIINPQNSIIDLPPSIVKTDVLSVITKTDSAEVAILEEKWTFILESIRPYNFSLEALLRSTKIKSAEGGIVILEVPYSFHQRILEAPKSKDLLESVISEVLQKPTKVTTTLGVRPQRIEDVANIEVAADDEIITMAADIFNGKLVD